MIRWTVASRDLPQRRGVRTPSFPHVFSGNPGETGTGPPIKTFGVDDFGPLRGEYSEICKPPKIRHGRGDKPVCKRQLGGL